MLNPPKVCPPDNPRCNEPGQGDASADGPRDGQGDGRRDGQTDTLRDGPRDGLRDADGPRDLRSDGRDLGGDRPADGAEVGRSDARGPEVPVDGRRDGAADGQRDVRPDGRADTRICAPVEICDNDEDDDCDGYVDCKDQACMADPTCIGQKKETCDNQLDDDANGFTDCRDPACFGDPACATPGVEVCNNSLDDDRDNLVDCADSDCANDPACKVAPGDEICDNGIDDNGDRLIDCTDPKCKTFPACLTSACAPDVDFGAIASSGASVTRTLSTTGATASFATCAAPGGEARVGSFSLAAATDVRLDFSQPAGAAHVVALFRAGVGQACDQNPVDCLRVGDKPTAQQTYHALPAGNYWLVVQSFPGTAGSTTVTLSTGSSGATELCDNGIDDDKDGALDCADLDCAAALTCNLCVPDIDLGVLVRDGPSKSATVDTTQGQDRYHTACHGTSTGKDVVVRFTVLETSVLRLDWRQTGDHLYALVEAPKAGARCDSDPKPGCPDWGGETRGAEYWSFLEPGDHLLIFKPVTAGQEGTVSITLRALGNRGVEICDNEIDDDGNQLVDCDDPSCFGLPLCAAPLCMPDGDLGDVGVGSRISLHADLTDAMHVFHADCAKGDGRGLAYRLNLLEPMNLEVEWKQRGDHVLQIARQVGPLATCDEDPRKNCADLSLLPTRFAFPELQPGVHYLLVQGFTAGSEGMIDLGLLGASQRVLEICDNGEDDDGDGFVDCNDRKCAADTSCLKVRCRADKDLGLLPLDGSALSAAVQTSGAGNEQAKSCVSAPGGEDAVFSFELPGVTNLVVEWAQVGNHALALYQADVAPVPCEANALVQCVATKDTSTGSFTANGLPAGKYYLVADADQPGSEGGVILQISGTNAR